MKNIFKNTLLSISLGLASITVMAASPTIVNIKVDTKDIKKDPNIAVIEDSIKNNIAEPNPAFNLNSITQVESIPELYEVVHNRNNLIYMTSDGKHIIDGSIISIKDMDNITASRKAKISTVNFKDLPKNPITYKYGTGVNKIAVFSDPKCPYCKSFEPELLKLKDVTISLYIIPILGEESMKISESILCSKKPGAAWSSWMLEGKMPEDKTCNTGAKTINSNLNFAKEYGINGTPAIIFSNGEVVKGKHPAEKIQEYFKNLSENPAEITKK